MTMHQLHDRENQIGVNSSEVLPLSFRWEQTSSPIYDSVNKPKRPRASLNRSLKKRANALIYMLEPAWDFKEISQQWAKSKELQRCCQWNRNTAWLSATWCERLLWFRKRAEDPRNASGPRKLWQSLIHLCITTTLTSVGSFSMKICSE